MGDLSPKQKTALEWVAETHKKYQAAKATALSDVKRMVEEQIAEHSRMRDNAVMDAIAAGVPKTKIGYEGLSTTSPNTVYNIVNRVKKRVEETGVELAVRPADKFSWGTVVKYYGPETFAAWVLVDGEEFESTISILADKLTHPGYAVMAQKGVAGAVAYTVHEGDRLTGVNHSREQYPELIAWIEANPPEVTA